MLTFGLEKEFFVFKSGRQLLVPQNIPCDECGYLAEARGQPDTDIVLAVFSLMAESYKLREMAKKNKVKISDFPYIEKPDTNFIRIAMRRFGKAPYPAQRYSLYGLEYTTEDTTIRAGLHIHFSSHSPIYYDGKIVGRTNKQLNIPGIVKYLDKMFESEIKNAKRLPGLYELKDIHGGFEYRSLPSNVSLYKVIDVILNMLNEVVI